ncbi:uncharacterized protein LOC130988147 isoform X1 [Salvia miltiorrhiza]|uniref:uncharacterized protein LOC130988147 isoform X1 n=1 Tax=Salvia miltiorrhiza TaxID=226208 RepID=UPI0025AC1DDA|nr:uncharacterized protein LOC130988147 isoform X1 [Salvia miltiorrhiza]
MRSWLLMFLLLLSVLIHDAQGRRLISNKGSAAAEADDGPHSLHQEKLAEMKSIDERESKKWSGSNRKLTLIDISSTTTIAKNGEMKAELKIGREEQIASVNSSSKTQQGQEGLDMAEMDYTLARRKPPIHN